MTFPVAGRRLVAALSGACALSVFPLASVAFAQDSAGAGPLEFTITANRGDTPLARAGSAVTVIPADEIRQVNPAAPLDVLRSQPGVSVSESGGPGHLSTIMLRGAEARHTLVLIDGVRVGDVASTGGEFDFSNLVATDIERIEILRGPQSALYGSDAIGGVINIVTRKGRGAPRASVQVEGGSYGTFSTLGSVSGGTDRFSYALSLLAARSVGFSAYGYRIPRLETLYGPFDKDGYTRFAGSARFSYRLTDNVEIEGGVYGGRLRSDYDAAFAGFGYLPDTPSVVKSRFMTAFVRAKIDTLDGLLRHRITGYATETDRKSEDVQRYDFGFGLTDEYNRYDYRGRRYGVEYQGDLALGPWGKLTFGGVVERETAKTATIPGLNSFNRPESAKYSRNSGGVFALYQTTLFDRLDLSLGGRVDKADGVRAFVTGRATAAYRIEETGTKLRASIGSGAKAPSLYQQFSVYSPSRNGFPALVPETSWGVDAGVDQTIIDGRLVLGATLFYNRIRNLIDFDGTLPSIAPFGGQYLNIARARTQGIEFAADGVISPDYLRVRASYTFLDARDVTTGLELARRPHHQGRISVAWTPIAKLTIEPTVFFVGERFSGRNQADPLKPYARLDARIAYQVTPNVEVYARGENLTNARYQEIKDYGTTGRAVYGGVRATW